MYLLPDGLVKSGVVAEAGSLIGGSDEISTVDSIDKYGRGGR